MSTKLETWYEWSRLKSGKRGTRLLLQCAWYSPYNTCGRCGRMGSERYVAERFDVYAWNRLHDEDYATQPIYMLCMSCWNKIRPVMRRKDEALELARLSRKLINEARKHGNKDRRDARELDGLHRAGEGGQAGPGQGDGHRQVGWAGEPVDAGGGERAA